jgi:hypothetical protein
MGFQSICPASEECGDRILFPGELLRVFLAVFDEVPVVDLFVQECCCTWSHCIKGCLHPIVTLHVVFLLLVATSNVTNVALLHL